MKTQDLLYLLREMGLPWTVARGAYEVAQRFGVLENRLAPCKIDPVISERLGVPMDRLDSHIVDRWHESRGNFFLLPSIDRYSRAISDPGKVLENADRAVDGELLYFSRWSAALGNPPDWLLDPINGVRYPNESHWSRISDLDESRGDIKYVWEASRFSQTYLFARAYSLTKDEKYAEAFWSQVESWVKANPPELGPNWRCGQEIAIRSFAWVFGLHVFLECKCTTRKRIALLIKNLWYNAWHIERNHWYAMKCVRNNHSLTEAAGLFTIGTLLPFFNEASRWRQEGLHDLEEELVRQVYPDGSYCMHSMNYARFVVQLMTWCLRIAQVNEVDISDEVVSRSERLLSFLWSMQVQDNGRLPNYGSNDGSLLFPLSSCDYLDYRPSLNALSMVLTGKRLYPPGPWEEEAWWFTYKTCSKPEVIKEPPANLSTCHRAVRREMFPIGGYYLLNGSKSVGMIRCGNYKDRPYQADTLHFDFWYGGCNVLVDSGTYSYNAEDGWTDYFVSTAAHNTVTVDRKNQMRKGSRFLWTKWAHGKTSTFGTKDPVRVFVGEHHGYSPVIHRRSIVQYDNTFLIVDDLFGDDKDHEYVLHWLIGDLDFVSMDSKSARIDIGEGRLCISFDCTQIGTGTWVKGDAQSRRGWQSLYYGERLPVWSYEMSVHASGPIRFFTFIRPVATDDSTNTACLEATNVVLKNCGLHMGPIDMLKALLRYQVPN